MVSSPAFWKKAPSVPKDTTDGGLLVHRRATSASASESGVATSGGASSSISVTTSQPGFRAVMAQMHQPDEFITEEAMNEGLQFLERLLDEMSGRTV